jgi:hypothetical protein
LKADVLAGKYIDATQDQQAVVDNIKEINDGEMYVMRVNQFSTGNEDMYKKAPIRK